MDSTSDDSFIWTDTSDNSNNMSIGSDTSHHKHKPSSVTSCIEEMHDANINQLKESTTHNNLKKAKKRKRHDSINSFQLDENKIKLESESDIEPKKKKKRKEISQNDDELNDSTPADESQLSIKVKQEQPSLQLVGDVRPKKQKKHKSCILENENTNNISCSPSKNDIEDYLTRKVKEEQLSLITPEVVKTKKKRRHKNSELNTDHLSDSLTELSKNDIEGYIDMRIKQEQASSIELEPVKLKKKKSCKTSDCNNVENVNEYNSMEELNDSNVISASLHSAEDNHTEYSIIEEKFSAEDTIVEKPKKKKHKRDKYESSKNDNNYREENCVDTSLQPGDFTLNNNNIASSTVLNISTMDALDTKHNQKDDVSVLNISTMDALDTKHNQKDDVSVLNISTMDALDTKHNQKDDVSRSNNDFHGITKISDRIRFEDEESLSHQEMTLKKASKIMNKHLKANPHLQAAQKIQQDFTITDDEEVWIIRCPQEIKHQKLQNTTLSLDGKCKIKVDGQTYDGVSNENINRITLMTFKCGQASVTNWPIKGYINYHRRIPKLYIPENISLIDTQENFIPLPETKCRHPLFGANYKKALKLPAAVRERLEAAKYRHVEASDETLIQVKHKKNKKKSRNNNMEDESKPDPESLKKNRKRKHVQGDDAPPKKRKHVKHSLDCTEAWESEKAIEENLFTY